MQHIFPYFTLKLNPTRDVAFDVKFFDVGFCYTISVSKSKLFVFIITHSKQEALLMVCIKNLPRRGISPLCLDCVNFEPLFDTR
jgi:hypothetical protein